MKKVILGIDLQYDFCSPRGALYVQGADKDVEQIRRLITREKESIDAITLSMDSHQPVHIAHQIYWKDKEGNTPNLFETIRAKDVENHKWIPQYNPELALDYLTKLESGGDLCTIWPPHCIIGTNGWSLDENIFEAIEDWAITRGQSYELVNKGMYQATEHYSIFKAAVEYPAIEATLFNSTLFERLKQFDQILIVGEAADFCVANSLKDLLAKAPEVANRVYMLTDCMSYIIEGSESARSLFEDAKRLGVHFCKSTEI